MQAGQRVSSVRGTSTRQYARRACAPPPHSRAQPSPKGGDPARGSWRRSPVGSSPGGTHPETGTIALPRPPKWPRTTTPRALTGRPEQQAARSAHRSLRLRNLKALKTSEILMRKPSVVATERSHFPPMRVVTNHLTDDAGSVHPAAGTNLAFVDFSEIFLCSAVAPAQHYCHKS